MEDMTQEEARARLEAYEKWDRESREKWAKVKDCPFCGAKSFIPLIFSGESVRKTQQGIKTMTRRIVPERIVHKYNDYDDWRRSVMCAEVPATRTFEREYFTDKCRYHRGDILWVKETWQRKVDGEDGPFLRYIYKADNESFLDDKYDLNGVKFHWRNSMYMPKEAARLFLKIIGVKVERLQKIILDDAKAEGMTKIEDGEVFFEFMETWDKLNAKRGKDVSFDWASDPWVYAISFMKIDKPEGWPC
jgi:hypothetical protein